MLLSGEGIICSDISYSENSEYDKPESFFMFKVFTNGVSGVMKGRVFSRIAEHVYNFSGVGENIKFEGLVFPGEIPEIQIFKISLLSSAVTCDSRVKNGEPCDDDSFISMFLPGTYRHASKGETVFGENVWHKNAHKLRKIFEDAKSLSKKNLAYRYIKDPSVVTPDTSRVTQGKRIFERSVWAGKLAKDKIRDSGKQ